MKAADDRIGDGGLSMRPIVVSGGGRQSEGIGIGRSFFARSR